MKTTPYSIHVDEDVAPFLDRHKKRAGKPESRGKYVSQCIRVYESIIDEKQAIKEEMNKLDKSLNQMRTIAREAFMASIRFRKMFQSIMEDREGEPTIGMSTSGLWWAADQLLEEAIEEKEREEFE